MSEIYNLSQNPYRQRFYTIFMLLIKKYKKIFEQLLQSNIHAVIIGNVIIKKYIAILKMVNMAVDI